MDQEELKEDNGIVLNHEELRSLFQNNVYFSDEYIEFLKNWLKDIRHTEVNGVRLPYLKTAFDKKMLALHYYSDEEINQLNKNGIRVWALKQNFNSEKTYHVMPHKSYPEILEGYCKSFRYYVRKAQEEELQLRMDWNLDDMYANYLETMKRLKTIVFPKEYFKLFKELSCAKNFNVVKENEVVASMITLENKDNHYHVFGFSNTKGRDSFANYFLYDSLFQYSSEKGLNTHLGSGFTDAGPDDFKRRTGAIKLNVMVSPKEAVNTYKLQRFLLKLPISFSHRFFSTRFFNTVIKSIIPYT